PLAEFSNILSINSKVPAKSAREFIALAKAKPGTINYGSAGIGTTPHLVIALFAKLAGIDLVHVPYRGIAPAMTDLVAGTIQAIAVGNATIASRGRFRRPPSERPRSRRSSRRPPSASLRGKAANASPICPTCRLLPR